MLAGKSWTEGRACDFRTLHGYLLNMRRFINHPGRTHPTSIRQTFNGTMLTGFQIGCKGIKQQKIIMLIISNKNICQLILFELLINRIRFVFVMTKRKYDFDLMKPGDEREIRCRVSERDDLLKRLRPLCSKYSGPGIKFKCGPVEIGIRYWAEEPEKKTA